MTKEQKNNAKKLMGVVIGTSMSKTAKVKVARFVKDQKYKKYIKKAKNYLVHDPRERAKVGDKVFIQETKPVSKKKRFKLHTIVDSSANTEKS